MTCVPHSCVDFTLPEPLAVIAVLISLQLPAVLLTRDTSPETPGLKATVTAGENVLEPFRPENVRLPKGAE